MKKNNGWISVLDSEKPESGEEVLTLEYCGHFPLPDEPFADPDDRAYCIGHGYLGADHFDGSAKGMESIARVMDTVGVSRWEDLPGKYVRVADVGWGTTITKFGNILEDKWFDCREFFSKKEV